LDCFSPGQDKDLAEIQNRLYGAGSRYVAFDPESHSLCSFGHLTNYGAKYYSYLWSKQLAKQLFSYIGAHGGPLDPVLGERYRAKVIGRGGSCEPQELVADFLSETSQ
jgi:thimet oligopeptidase